MSLLRLYALIVLLLIAAGITCDAQSSDLTTTLPAEKRATHPVDNLILKMLGVIDTSFGKGLKASLKSLARGPTAPFLYGMSFAAAMALAAGVSETKPLARLFTNSERPKRVKSSLQDVEDQLTSGSSSSFQMVPAYSGQQYANAQPADPVVQKFLTTNKDGSEQFHHIFHYHVPYPMSVQALGAQAPKYNGPHLPWYSPEQQNALSGKPFILSSYSNNNPSMVRRDHFRKSDNDSVKYTPVYSPKEERVKEYDADTQQDFYRSLPENSFSRRKSNGRRDDKTKSKQSTSSAKSASALAV